MASQAKSESNLPMERLIANTYAPPFWLNEDFLQDALRSGLRRESLNMVSCTIRPATNIGDNYLSQMFRASTKMNSNRKGSETKSVVIKTMPKGQVVENFMNDNQFFTREAAMLSETLPLLKEILEEAGLRERLSAELYFNQGEPHNSLVIEDLCEAGFKNVNRLKGLDLEHSTLVVEHLAAFHAASLVAIKRHPEIKQTYLQGFWQRHNKSFVEKFYFNKSITALADCLKVWKNMPVEIMQKIDRLIETGAEKLFKCTDLYEEELNVLNHADPWVSNMMFKYENGKPIDIRFVDFQLCYYNSPAFDLLYFFFTSPHLELRIEKLDYFLEKYHTKLCEICEKLHFPLQFSIDDLKKIFYKRMYLAFFNTIVLLPFMIADSAEAPDLNKFLKEDKNSEDDFGRVANMITNTELRKILEQLLPFFNRSGVLD